jgi:hypothetical protein
MRVVLCAALLSVLVLTGCSGVSKPLASIEVAPGMPQPDAEDDNPLGLRIWSLHPRVVVRFRRNCRDARYSSTASTSLNRVRAGWGGGNGAESDLLGRVPAGRVVTERSELDAYAGQTVRLHLRVSCGASATVASRTFELPPASCDGGLLHVYELQGAVEWTNEQGNGVTAYPLRDGDLVQTGDELRVGRGGHAVVGAAECNGLRLDLGPGTYTVGGYRSDARGDGFRGARAVVTADSHAGAWESGGLQVLPLDSRCSACTTAAPAVFEVRTGRVRVSTGVVLARLNGRSVRVSAGEEAGVECARASRCRLVGARIYQPSEPWSTPLAARPELLPSVRSARAGSEPPPRQLAPAFSQVRLFRLPAAGGAPEQIAVQWAREVRSRPGADTEPQAGVLIWQRVTPTRWRIVYRLRSISDEQLGVSVGDVSGDGHPDVLALDEQGSGACGPRVLVAWAAGRERTLVAHNECESIFVLRNHALVVDEPVGPCPHRLGSAHCFGGVRHVVMRWRGARLVTHRATVKCALPRLDPSRGCVRRRH